MKLNIKNGVIQDNSIMGASFKRGIVPIVTGKHRPGAKGAKSSVTIHNTDNTVKSAGAESHRQYLYNCETKSPTASQVSWHFVVDDKEIVQCIPIDEVAYCQGHATGNKASISIEICDNQYNYDRAKYLKAEENAAKLAASLLETLGIKTIYQHYDWTRKNCPSKIRKEGRWNSYVNKINSYKGTANTSGTVDKEEEVDYTKRALIVYNNPADLEGTMTLIKWLEGSYIVDLINGSKFNKHDFSGYRHSNWRIAIGDKNGKYTSQINYHIAGKNKKETLDMIADFRNHADHRDNYKVKK